MYIYLNTTEKINIGLIVDPKEEKPKGRDKGISWTSIHAVSNPLDLVNDPYFEKFMFFTSEEEYLKQLNKLLDK